MKNILVTGGAGYIGSHVCISLIKKGYNPIVVDNLSNSNLSRLNEIKKIFSKKINFKIADTRDRLKLKKIIISNKISIIIHLAALKSVEESLNKPYKYIDNNINGLINLLNCFPKNQLEQIIFSSSACVYGSAKKFPIKETDELKYENIYGFTKIVGEQIVENFCRENKTKYANLRYFNPSGCYKSGKIGENFSKKDKSLTSNLLDSLKQNKKFSIFGSNCNTKDGTPARDFVHVMDIADGHIKALNYLLKKNKNITCNLGSGKATTVLEMVNNFQHISKQKINLQFIKKRKGDAEMSYASIKKAQKELKWKPKKTLSDINRSNYKWLLFNS